MDNSRTLDSREVKTLLWLCNGEEPNEERSQYELTLMDANHDGVIDFYEWIKYLTISYDSETNNNSNENGRQNNQIFDFGLKMKFDLYDVNNDGTIS